MRSFAILLFPVALMAQSPLPALPTPEEIRAADTVAAKAEGRKLAKKPSTKAVKKGKTPTRIDGFYLDLPTAYVMPAEVQSIFKEHIQGVSQLEGDYSKYCQEKQRLIDWVLVRLEEKRQIAETKWKDEALRYVAEVSAYKVSSLDELRSKRDENKRMYEASHNEGAYQMYTMIEDTLDRIPKRDKYRQILDGVTSDIEKLKEWRKG